MPTPIPETLVFTSIAQRGPLMVPNPVHTASDGPLTAPAVRPSASPKRPRLVLALYTLAHLGGVL